MASERVHKSIMNAKVGFIFYFITIIMAFFSRRIFLECLGDDFIGLTGTLLSILNILNISELGFGTCIGYFLYKPIEQGDNQKICELVSLFGWIYRIIGTFIFVIACIISLLFPLMFESSNISLGIVYFAFFSFLGSNIIGYYINYRQILLDSNQKTYKVTIWHETTNIIKTITQILLAYYYKNLYIWVAIEFLYSVITCIILNIVINHEYPWLKTNKNNGRDILRKYPEILVKAKQIVIHRLKNALLSRSDEIFIFAFESLQVVAFYGNYNMIVGKLTAVFNTVFTGMNASIGNLVAEGNKWNIRKGGWSLLPLGTGLLGFLLLFLLFSSIQLLIGG